MMKKSIIILSVAMLGFIACSKKSPTKPEDDTSEKPLTSVIIGQNGGVLETEDFKITIPAGSFSSNTEIKMTVSTEKNPYSENAVSDVFQIEGIPVEYSKPITLSIRYSGSLKKHNCVAIGAEVLNSDMDEPTISYFLYPATDSSGYLICELPVPESKEFSIGTVFKTNSAAQTSNIVKAQGITDVIRNRSSEQHFEIYSTVPLAPSEEQELLKAFEEAFNMFQTMEYTFENTRKWPMAVQVRDFGNNKRGSAMSRL
jgi:hypothetical protein